MFKHFHLLLLKLFSGLYNQTEQYFKQMKCYNKIKGSSAATRFGDKLHLFLQSKKYSNGLGISYVRLCAENFDRVST